MRPKWDTPLNRALNELKGLPLGQRPQYGRVHGAGDGATWKVFYNEGPEAKKQKKKFSQADIDAKVKLAVEKKAAEDAKKAAEDKYELLQQAVNAAVTACRNDFATNLVPVIINWTKENPDKTVHDFPLPSFVGRNSMNNNTIAPSLAYATGPPIAAAPAHSSPSSVSGVLGGPSSLAELDAVTVITCRTNIYIYIDNIPFLLPFGCFTPQTYVFAGERNPVHHTLLDQRPEGGRGEGDDIEPIETHVPQPADPCWALQG